MCPKGLIGAFELELLELYGHYKNKILPFSGGILEQPHVYAKCMLLIEAVYSEYMQRGK